MLKFIHVGLSVALLVIKHRLSAVKQMIMIHTGMVEELRCC